ncbi:MAG: bestrophin family ion channel [Planctomycetota bacterium]
MIVDGATRLRTIVRDNVTAVMSAVAVVAAIELLNRRIDFIQLERAVFSMAALGLLTTALSIFLAFRVNEAYARWWEARILWGGVVNASRTFARQATTLIGEPESGISGPDSSSLARELVYRHVAYINALRLHLRRQSNDTELASLLSSRELDGLSNAKNRPTQILQTQGVRIAELRRDGRLDGFAHLMLDGTLSELCNLQGGCERIKNTVFPDRVAFFTRVVAWAMAVLIPVCIIEADNSLDAIDFVILPAMMLLFIVTERLGAELKTPFENRANDTPMSALCRSIEIDLRQQLRETEVPEPLLPQAGVLL